MDRALSWDSGDRILCLILPLSCSVTLGMSPHISVPLFPNLTFVSLVYFNYELSQAGTVFRYVSVHHPAELGPGLCWGL